MHNYTVVHVTEVCQELVVDIEEKSLRIYHLIYTKEKPHT